MIKYYRVSVLLVETVNDQLKNISQIEHSRN
ncbi:MAG: transposase [cyanobacterium endosymbiont of Rhopalodia yunnanensis]